MTPAKMSTPGTLDKLFASTPRQNSEGTVSVCGWNVNYLSVFTSNAFVEQVL